MKVAPYAWQRLAQPRSRISHLGRYVGYAVLWLVGSTVLCTHGVVSQ